jgi:hypothetical protein
MLSSWRFSRDSTIGRVARANWLAGDGATGVAVGFLPKRRRLLRNIALLPVPKPIHEKPAPAQKSLENQIDPEGNITHYNVRAVAH